MSTIEIFVIGILAGVMAGTISELFIKGQKSKELNKHYKELLDSRKKEEYALLKINKRIAKLEKDSL